MEIKLNNLTLTTFNKDDKNHLDFMKNNILSDQAVTSRVQGLFVGLLGDRGEQFFDRAFLFKDSEELIGYIKIGEFNQKEKYVFLRSTAISKEHRGKGYGKKLLEELSQYIFINYNEVESIRLKIASDNNASLGTANACGYKWLEGELYYKDNPYINKKLR